MISVGCSSVCCSSTTESSTRLSRRCRDGDAVQAGELVGDQVVERDSALLAEVVRVRTGVNGADRHHEAEAVGRRHLAAAPSPGERDAVLSGDQGSVGARQRLGPDVVLPDPAQSRAAQCGHVEPDHRLESRIASFREQHGADAGRDIAGARAALARVGESVREPGARVHLEQQLGQVDPWQSRGDGRFERDRGSEARPISLEGGQHQFATLDRHVGVAGQVRGGRSIRGIEAIG